MSTELERAMRTSASPRVPARALAAIALAAAAVFAASCGGGAAPTPQPSATASAAPSAAPTGARSSQPTDEKADEIRPVYRVENKPPLPEAERYCAATVETPAKRRDACCPGTSSTTLVGECVRTLSSALRSGALAVDAAALDACLADADKATTGCDWVTGVGWPLPSACAGIFKGNVKDGEVCRSNLECADGLRCRGLGATRAGKCGPPAPARRPCNTSTDPLASFTHQSDLEPKHPECEGFCGRHQCAPTLAIGAACDTSAACGRDGNCVRGKCTEGGVPDVGQACGDRCKAGARCVNEKCVAPRAIGEACDHDGECLGRCDRHSGEKVGVCMRDCPVMPKVP